MQNRLFVRGFGAETNISYLEELFSNVGNVKKAALKDVLMNGVIRRVAYIEMTSPQEASDCIDRFHGMSTSGYTLTVTEDRPHVPDASFRPLKAKNPKQRKRSATNFKNREL